MTRRKTTITDQSAEIKAKQAAGRAAAKARGEPIVGTLKNHAGKVIAKGDLDTLVGALTTSVTKAAKTPSKADAVRKLLDQGKSVRECADALKDRG